MGAYASLENNAVVKSGGAGSAIGTVTSAAIDTAGYSEATVFLTLGAAVATGTLAVKVQDCATVGGIYVDVPGAAFTGKIDTDDDKAFVGRLKLDGNLVKRFVKVVGVVGVAVMNYGVAVVLSGNQYAPQTEATVEFTI